MAMIINNANQIIDSGLLETFAMDKVREMYEELDIDTRLTGISIVCSHAVMVLSRNELEFLLDNNSRFFQMRKYDSEQMAFVVTDKEYQFLKENCYKLYIVNDNFKGKIVYHGNYFVELE